MDPQGTMLVVVRGANISPKVFLATQIGGLEPYFRLGIGGGFSLT